MRGIRQYEPTIDVIIATTESNFRVAGMTAKNNRLLIWGKTRNQESCFHQKQLTGTKKWLDLIVKRISYHLLLDVDGALWFYNSEKWQHEINFRCRSSKVPTSTVISVTGIWVEATNHYQMTKNVSFHSLLHFVANIEPFNVSENRARL